MKRIAKIFTIPVLLIVFLFQILPADVVKAEQSNDLTRSGIIDNISYSSVELLDGEKFSVDVLFSEKPSVTVKEGDYIKLVLPQKNQAYIHAFNKQFELNNSAGLTFAKVDIQQSVATIIFNEVAEKMENVKGTFKFSAIARNLNGESSEENITELDGSLGSKIDKNLLIRRGPSGGTTDTFYYKTGDMQPNDSEHVRWFLVYNPSRQSKTDGKVLISDNIVGDHSFTFESMRVNVNGSMTGSYSIEEFNNSNIGFIEYTDNKITITINEKFINDSITFSYLTKIQNTSAREFLNNSSIEYIRKGDTSTTKEDSNYSVNNIEVDGSIDGNYPGSDEIKIIKKIEGTETTIKDVSFNLYDSNDLLVESKMTDDNGEIVFSSLTNGSYYVVEVDAPIWVDFSSDNRYQVEINTSDTKGQLLVIENAIKVSNIVGNKVWVGGPSQKPTIELQLLQNGAPFGNSVSLKHGETSYTWINVPQTDNAGNKYTYSIREVNIPQNYNSELSADGLTVTNTYESPLISVTGNKVWIGGPSEKPTIELQLLQNGDPFGSSVSLKDGETSYTWDSLPLTDNAGNKYTYSIREVNIPGNYNSELSADGLTVTNTYESPLISVTGNKVWIGGPSKKPTIELLLLQNGAPFGNSVSLKDGETSYTWTNLPQSDNLGNEYSYTISEVTIPENYISKLSSDGLTVTNTYSFTNVPPIKPSNEEKAIVKGVSKPIKDVDTLPQTGIDTSKFGNIGVLILSVGITLHLKSKASTKKD
ncbi:Cna B-type domain-containing protein [Erysipelothrix aquatica]|uniref:Cna B-type domain-containing protein n=1 Tax=Erysipelothrix aquatica TaxID=2683714 RepID=UPI00135C7CD5|nr:Cna B-type domain-containing protein [Erysipelothrix aquatica]